MDPMRSLLARVSFVSLSFEDLSISCTVGDSRVVPLYVGKLMVFPTCIALLIPTKNAAASQFRSACINKMMHLKQQQIRIQ